MIVRKFLAWSATASPAERAPAAAALARALMSGELPPEEVAEATMALAGLADDPAPLVRLALSGELAAHANAPRHVVIALAADQSEIAAPVLRASPLLTDADLVDAAAIGDALSQTAIALRETVSSPVCAALAEVGLRECVVALLGNEGAAVPRDALARIVQRFAAEAEVREVLLRRGDLPPAERAHLVEAAAQTLQDFVIACGWMPPARAERAAREAREKGLVIIAAEAADDRAAASMARCLRQAGRLTPALLLRSLLSGERRLFQSALAELSGVAPDQAAGCVENFNGGAFAALYCRSELPESLLPVFRSALAALAEGPGQDEFADGGLLRTLVERVLPTPNAPEQRNRRRSPAFCAGSSPKPRARRPANSPHGSRAPRRWRAWANARWNSTPNRGLESIPKRRPRPHSRNGRRWRPLPATACGRGSTGFLARPRRIATVRNRRR